ncbi:MAG: ABC transporter substrate-binding protein [Pseudomonadota bacterium]
MRTLLSLPTAALVFCLALAGSTIPTASPHAEEDFTVSIISVSVYGPWFIVKEKGLADGINVDVKIIEDTTARNAGLSNNSIQCIMTTMDNTVVTASSAVPVKHVAVPLMSYGLDQMVVSNDIQTEADLRGRTFAADYGFLNHMWMLLTLKRAGIPFDEVNHTIMLPQESTAAFASGALDVDVTWIPFSTQSLEREDSHMLKSSFTDKTWERGLISDSIACNQEWLDANPDTAREVIRAWFEAVNWWKENPDEGNEIVAAGLDWPVEDVSLTQYGAVMLNINQNMGAVGLEGGEPLCASIPEGAPEPPAAASGWGQMVGDKADCEAGYLADTWELFADVYSEAGVMDERVSAADGIDNSIIEWLNAEGYDQEYGSNKWIGRVGP